MIEPGTATSRTGSRIRISASLIVFGRTCCSASRSTPTRCTGRPLGSARTVAAIRGDAFATPGTPWIRAASSSGIPRLPPVTSSLAAPISASAFARIPIAALRELASMALASATAAPIAATTSTDRLRPGPVTRSQARRRSNPIAINLVTRATYAPAKWM
jgi:hypothetical protein